MEEPWILTDAHGHIGTKEERSERQKAGIISLLCAVSPEEAEELISKSKAEHFQKGDIRLQKGYLLPTCGIHPWYADRYRLQDMEKWMELCPVIGEIGMDTVWCSVDLKIQEERFCQQLELACRQSKPVILHTKGQEKQIADIIREYPNRYLVHWYSCDSYLADYLEQDCYFSIGPDVWWNCTVRQVAKKVPMERLLIETDGLSAIKWAYEEGMKACKGNTVKWPKSYGKGGGVVTALKGTLEIVAEIQNITPQEAGRQIQNNFIHFIGDAVYG